MKTIIILTFLIISLYNVRSDNFLAGNVYNRVHLINETRVEYNAIPFIKRVKYYFYSNPGNKKIAGIQALDGLLSKATITVTAGGVGNSFVNLRMKSQRGYGLKYDIGIYVAEEYY